MDKNPIKRLRGLLGWNQATLGQAIGRSWQSVQNYEAGKRVPPEVIDKLKTLAAQRGFADVALDLSSEEWQVRRVFYPGEKLISQASKRGTASQRSGEPARASDRSDAHELLDQIYDSGSAEATAAAYQNLAVLARYVRLEHTKLGISKKKREAGRGH